LNGWVLFGAVVVVLALGMYLSVRAGWWQWFSDWETQRLEQARADREFLIRQRQRGVDVPLQPEYFMDHAVEGITRSGYALENRTVNSATFVKEEGANVGLGCCLMALFVLPGLLYLLLARSTVRVTLAAYPHEGGSRVTVGGDDLRAVEELSRWVREIAENPPTLPIPAARGAAERLRQLDGLKSAGLLSEQEYQAKRTQILGEM
jgi:hypothetical protein